MNEKYNLEKAQEEASVLKKKVDSKEATSYSHAENLVEHEKEQLEQARENAKNGEIAKLIQSLDLSTQEGRSGLREILTPWNPDKTFELEDTSLRKNKDEYIQDQKILRPDGTALFPFGENIHLSEGNLSCSHGLLQIESLLEEYNSGIFLKDKLNTNGHRLAKCLPRLIDFFDIKEDFKSMSDLDPRLFVGTLDTSSSIAHEALNGSDTGSTIIFLSRIPEEEMEKHPNYPSLKKLLDCFREFFDVWNETFYQFLSHIIQNPNYSIEGGWDKTFLEDRYLGYHLKSSDKSIIDSITNKLKNGELSQEVEDQALFLIDKIKQYQTILEESCEKMGYAKPKED